ncbi:hypothetical protein ACFL35_07405 [Candidatus Riflebacteria bacterium]
MKLKKHYFSMLEVVLVLAMAVVFIVPIYLFLSQQKSDVEITEAEFYALNAMWEMKEQILAIDSTHLEPQKLFLKAGIAKIRILPESIPIDFSSSARSFDRIIEIHKDKKNLLWLKLIIRDPKGKSKKQLQNKIFLGSQD